VAEPFRVRIAVRGYEIDAQGHLGGVVYLQYGEHARWECLRAAGITPHKLAAAGVGPVQLETTIRFHRELRAGDEVDVSCAFMWGTATRRSGSGRTSAAPTAPWSPSWPMSAACWTWSSDGWWPTPLDSSARSPRPLSCSACDNELAPLTVAVLAFPTPPILALAAALVSYRWALAITRMRPA
jgi:hypothetical protein